MSPARLPLVLALSLLLPAGCGGEEAEEDVRCGRGGYLLEPAPPGAPEDPADPDPRDKKDGDLSCLGTYWLARDPNKGSVLLPGYVRELENPGNDDPARPCEPDPRIDPTPCVPEAEVTAFRADGGQVAPTRSDLKTGRVALTFGEDPEGFAGVVRVTMPGRADYWLSSSIPYPNLPQYNAFPWMATAAQVADAAEAGGAPLDLEAGVVVGSVHDCGRFGLANVVVLVEGGHGAVHYVGEGWTLDPERTYTGATGRFAVTGLPAGDAELSAFARVGWGCGLVHLGTGRITVRPGAVTALDLSPRLQ